MNINTELPLSGIDIETEVPTYLIQDATKLLRVNATATGLEWANDIKEDGFMADRGDGSTNTASDYVGFIFENKLNSGLFNYDSGPNDVLALKHQGSNVLDTNGSQININNNIFLQNDSLLSSSRIAFGNSSCGISGDSTTNNQNKISFRTDSQERLQINTQDGLLCKSLIKIDSGVVGSASAPHMYMGGTFVTGITLDSTLGKITLSSGTLYENMIVQYNQIDLKRPVIFRGPQCYPDYRIIEAVSYTVPANLSGNYFFHMKRSATTNTDITFPQPSANFNPRYEIVTDGMGITSTFNIRLNTLSNDVLNIANGARTLLTGPVVNSNLVLNAHYIVQFCEADNRWVFIRTT